MREDQQLEIFIRKHYSSMCAVALRFIGSPDIAQDITQEVIIKFWKNRANYENIKSSDNFLYTMIKNEALNYLRGSQREKQRYNHLEVEEFEQYVDRRRDQSNFDTRHRSATRTKRSYHAPHPVRIREQGNRKSHGCFREHDQNTQICSDPQIERIFQFE